MSATPTDAAQAPQDAQALLTQYREDSRVCRSHADQDAADAKLLTALTQSAPQASPEPVGRDWLLVTRQVTYYAADCAAQELKEAKNLYGHYPEDGLGRKVKAAQAQVDQIALALASRPAETPGDEVREALVSAIAEGEFESLPALSDKLERAALSFEAMASQARNGAYVAMDEWYEKRDSLRAISQRVRAALASPSRPLPGKGEQPASVAPEQDEQGERT